MLQPRLRQNMAMRGRPSLRHGLARHYMRIHRGRHGTFSTTRTIARDPRVHQILDDYADLRTTYKAPRNPIVLAHGLFGFAEIPLPFHKIYYWHGITTALTARGARVITPAVPPSSSIKDRATVLAQAVREQNPENAPVNIIAHSMGGLDARYMIRHLTETPVASLTTIATPHRGSPVADYLVEPGAGPLHLPKLYGVISRLGLGTSAFEQLTTRYMQTEFNPITPDDPAVQYFSFGADVMGTPSLFSSFRLSHSIINEAEGPNDGLVSVESSNWGQYQGTLMGVSHLDLINWPNRMRWAVREWMGMKRNFNAVAFYLGVADMLASKGL